MDERERRIAENEALFRVVNDETNAVEERFGGDDALRRSEIVCECGTRDCRERIEITREEYEAVRVHPQRFIVRPAHDEPGAEVVVARTDRYSVVEKLGAARLLAADTDPRS